MTNSIPFRHNREEMRMSLRSKQNKRYIAVPAFAALIAVTAPMASPSAMSFPDLVFPEPAPVPTAKPDHLVTGSISRNKKATEVREDDRATASKPARKGTQRVMNSKEAQR